jgi:Domain of unknown function (DUF4406)
MLPLDIAATIVQTGKKDCVLNKLVYIAGPYSGKKLMAVEANIETARSAAIWCARKNIYYFCPHLNSALFDLYVPETSVDFYYAMDKIFLTKCDAILLLPKWEYSTGASGEYNEALTLGLRTFEYPVDCGLLLEWYKGAE